VRRQLLERYDPETTHFVVVTGTGYQKHLFTPESGFSYETPLQTYKTKKRRGIGTHRSWLKKQLEDLNAH
jgi:hypothetical protein